MAHQRYYKVEVEGIRGNPKDILVLAARNSFFYRAKDGEDLKKKIKRDREILRKELGGPNLEPERLEVLTIKEIKFRD